MKKGIIFDLDGTLLNTLDDLADSVNAVLQERELPVHPVTSYRNFVGNGARILVSRALPESLREDNIIDACHQRFIEIYNERWNVRTAPYPGISDLLDVLNAEHIPVGIVTNKPHEAATECARAFLPQIRPEAVHGQQPAFPTKPDPESTLRMCRILGIDPAESLFVGDSNVDMKTAANTGMKAIGVSWGFRTVEELRESGAYAIAQTPGDITEYL